MFDRVPLSGKPYTVNVGAKLVGRCAWCGMSMNLNRSELTRLHLCVRGDRDRVRRIIDMGGTDAR